MSYKGEKVRLDKSRPQTYELVTLTGSSGKITLQFPVGIRLTASEARAIKVDCAGYGTRTLTWAADQPNYYIGDFLAIYDDANTTAANGEVEIYHDRDVSALPAS